MPLIQVKGDLFLDPSPALGHGCNCAGAMGKGIAVDFKKRYPRMYLEYRQRCLDGRLRLGEVFVWEAVDAVIYNLGTQAHWKTGAEIWAVESAVRTMLADAEARALPRIGIPRIGAGLGGLEWSVVEGCLFKLAEHSPVELRVFEYVAA